MLPKNRQQKEERSTRATHLSVIVSALLPQMRSKSWIPLSFSVNACEKGSNKSILHRVWISVGSVGVWV